MKPPPARRPIITDDGSSSFYSEEFGDFYHSRHGALREARHIFIRAGLEALSPERTKVNVFEMGLGTGLNALLTVLEQGARDIHYTALELRPVTLEETRHINYPEVIADPVAYGVFVKLHMVSWSEWFTVRPGFAFRKIREDLKTHKLDRAVDLIYFDAFSPDAQPDLWTGDIFRKFYDKANPGAVFVTYSAKGAVRRALESAGWSVERLPGPPGKREILRGRKQIV
jgi:tRNA U34 5-methylaminomethyl-2-thiouridine-forming methyltransferase MnmC